MSKPLVAIPTFVENERAVELTVACVKSIQETADADIYVIDDGSPEEFSSLLQVELPSGVQERFLPFNKGFAAAANSAFVKANITGQDICFVNADMLFFEEGWLEILAGACANPEVYIAGGMCLYPQGLIQSAGMYYSKFSREFDHIYKYAPGNLPEAQVARQCPVSSAFMYVPYDTYVMIDQFDEMFEFGYEDVDYCFRASLAGGQVWMVPQARAIHYEAQFCKSDPDYEKKMSNGGWYLSRKHAGIDFGPFVPTLLEIPT